ncbi:MAG TPA: radical SAM protein [Steroidobacteraceae bacterium]|nr:radical SAM protein [Steroidobacteraceae bacterium]
MKDIARRRRVLLINPTITSRRNARFPLAVLSLAAAIESRYDWQVLDGNIDRDFAASAVKLLRGGRFDAVGVTVMGGPQVPSAVTVTKAIRTAIADVPIVWGGYFPTICPDAAMASCCVDFAVRGQGEATFNELLDAWFGDRARIGEIPGLSWRRDGDVVHNPERPFSAASLATRPAIEKLEDPRQYLGHTYLGRRTAGFQAALGCRFRCTFCGVATMFRGKTALPAVERLDADLTWLSRELGVDSINFYDHNFFDREVDMVPLLEVMARHQLPWWCFARSDALVEMSASTWALVRKSRLRMAYIGAESPNDRMLHDIRKGTKTDQTLEVVEKCRANGVVPELSFMLAPPEDPEGETEKTFHFIRRIKRLHPATEIMLYIYTPLPPAPHIVNVHQKVVSNAAKLRDVNGAPLEFPTSAEGWSEPEWVAYWSHTDAPWLRERLRRRIRDFTTVLGCRFPTITDIRSPPLAKRALRALSAWRYRFERYDRPWELDLSRQFVRLRDPRATGL